MAGQTNVPVIAVERFRVDHGAGLTTPVISLADRRAAGNRLVRFVFQRHLEAVLYGRVEGSSGPIWKLLSQSGMGRTTLLVSKQNVKDKIITEPEYDAVMAEFRATMPSDMVDPSSVGRIRNCTLLPLAAAATVVRSFGRSAASLAWLRAFDHPIPQAWELREQLEATAAAGEVDYVLEEQLADEHAFEAEDISFADELKIMAAFSADTADDERLKTYAMQRVPPLLKSGLDMYVLYRTETFAARRQGGAVQSISAEADRTALLRFFGWMERTGRVPTGANLYVEFLCRPDLGTLAQEYTTWLQHTQGCKFSTIANYINGLVSLATYAYGNLEPSPEVLNSEPNPLTQLINLRGQAEKASKTQQMYEQRVGGWLTWEDVQKARLSAFAKLDAAATPSAKLSALRDAAALALLSLIPPDRVGIIRKLRLGHTLKRAEGGGWKMDLSKQRDGHKTSRFYGPFCASLPPALTPILNKYAAALELEVGGETAYLFHPPNGSNDRPMESAAWTGWVKRLFKRHHGSEVAPKTLRSVFVTWLRDSTSAPEILKSAAHAQKHKLQTKLAEAGFELGRAMPNGDCFPLSAMAGFEISAARASAPTTATNASVQEVREGAIGFFTGQEPIDGIDASILRSSELLPTDATAAAAELAPWLRNGFWTDDTGGRKAATFQLGVALQLGRPVAVVQRRGDAYLDPALVYGARDAGGGLVHSIEKEDTPETIPTYKIVSLADLLATLQTAPTSLSIIEYNGTNHYDPWLLKAANRAWLRASAKDPPPPPPLPPPPACGDDADADAIAAAARSNHLELNVLPSGMPPELPPLAAAARETLCRSQERLQGEGEATTDISGDAAAAAMLLANEPPLDEDDAEVAAATEAMDTGSGEGPSASPLPSPAKPLPRAPMRRSTEAKRTICPPYSFRPRKLQR